MRRFAMSYVALLGAALGCGGDEGTTRTTTSSGSSGGGSGMTASTTSSSGGTAGPTGSAVSAGPSTTATTGGGAGSSVSTGAGGAPIDAAGGASSTGAGGASTDAAHDGGGGSTASDAGSDVSATCTPGTGTVDVGAQSVLDRKTCLVWEKAPGASMTNKQAAKYCGDLNQDGFGDWRVPAPEELATSPSFVTNSNAYITNPIYIPTSSASDQEGCTGNSHSCNLTQYNAGSIACAWQGVGFSGPVVCVRGTAAAGTTAAAYRASSCTGCSTAIADFKIADCLPFAQ